MILTKGTRTEHDDSQVNRLSPQLASSACRPGVGGMEFMRRHLVHSPSACISLGPQPAGTSSPAENETTVHFCDHFLSFSLLSSTIASKYPSGWRVALAAACSICSRVTKPY